MPGHNRQQVVLGEAVIDLTCDVNASLNRAVAAPRSPSSKATVARLRRNSSPEQVACITAEARTLGGI